MKKVFGWLKESRGTTAIEYSLIVGGITVAISTIVFTVGTDLTALFQQVGIMAASFAG